MGEAITFYNKSNETVKEEIGGLEKCLRHHKLQAAKLSIIQD